MQNNTASVVYILSLWGCESCGILAPQPGIEPTPSALEGEIPSAGPPGKSHRVEFLAQSPLKMRRSLTVTTKQNKNPIASNKPQIVEGLWVGDEDTTADDNNW